MKKQQSSNPMDEIKMERLIKDIKEAQEDWKNANQFFQYAVGRDQVDYAIYAIISAEKRYEMLLRTAKLMTGSWPVWRGEWK